MTIDCLPLLALAFQPDNANHFPNGSSAEQPFEGDTETLERAFRLHGPRRRCLENIVLALYNTVP